MSEQLGLHACIYIEGEESIYVHIYIHTRGRGNWVLSIEIRFIYYAILLTYLTYLLTYCII